MQSLLCPHSLKSHPLVSLFSSSITLDLDQKSKNQSSESGLDRHMMLCSSLRDRLRPWLRDYDRLQACAIILIYIQIGCALLGSLGAQYNGVLLINLAIALFALVAIESSSESLGRTYALLLFCALLLDISWFILFGYEIWHISSGSYGRLFVFSVKLALVMQIIAFSVRMCSSLLWIQIYRLGANTVSRDADFDFRNSFLNPTTPSAVRQSPRSDGLGGSIYDPTHFSCLFQDRQDNGLYNSIDDKESASAAEDSHMMLSTGRSLQDVDDGNAANKPPQSV